MLDALLWRALWHLSAIINRTVLFGSYEPLSARAHRESRFMAALIDALFLAVIGQQDHCRECSDRDGVGETRRGGPKTAPMAKTQ